MTTFDTIPLPGRELQTYDNSVWRYFQVGEKFYVLFDEWSFGGDSPVDGPERFWLEELLGVTNADGKYGPDNTDSLLLGKAASPEAALALLV